MLQIIINCNQKKKNYNKGIICIINIGRNENFVANTHIRVEMSKLELASKLNPKSISLHSYSPPSRSLSIGHHRSRLHPSLPSKLHLSPPLTADDSDSNHHEGAKFDGGVQFQLLRLWWRCNSFGTMEIPNLSPDSTMKHLRFIVRSLSNVLLVARSSSAMVISLLKFEFLWFSI